MTIQEIFLILSFLINFGLGLFVSARPSTHRRINLVFSLLCFGCAFWVLGALMIPMSDEVEWKLFWIRFIFAVSCFIPAVLLHFSLVFPIYTHRVKLAQGLFVYLPAFVFLVASPTELVVKSILQVNPIRFDYGPLHAVISVYFAVYLTLGFYFLSKTYRTSIGIYRLQIKYCFIGMLLTAIASFVTNLLLPTLGTSRLSGTGPSFTMIMVGFTTYSIAKYRLMDINLVLKKGTTYAVLGVFFYLPSAFLVFVGQHIFFHDVSYLFSVLVLALIILASVLFNKMKPQTEKAVEQLLFKHRYDYRETLVQFSKAMVSILDLQSLSKRIIETISRTMGVEKASLFLLKEEKGGYSLFESRNLKAASFIPLLSKGDPLPRYLQKAGEIIVREELMKKSNDPDVSEVAEKMALLEAEVSIPLTLKGQLLGIINLSHKFDRDIYSHEDLELLGTLANQTAIALENATLYEDLKKSKSYIRRADRLASLGTLTAGLAHEIRNPLVAIKTFTQLLPERMDDEEFRNQFLSIASGEVDRISALVTELLNFARPSEPKLESEDINLILDGMILLVSTESKKKQVELMKEYASDLPSVSIDKEQIKQVFLNVLLNAVDATPESGNITVRTRSIMKATGEAYVQIEFSDTGCGIPEEFIEQIFNPFFSTKTKGSGLGLSISNQIIQDHRGYIHVESRVDQGSSFFINLPLDQEYPRRRREEMDAYQDPRAPMEQL
jgi:signal transduction histidine kinase